MPINKEYLPKLNPQEHLFAEARKRIEKLRQAEQKARAENKPNQTAHFDKVSPEELQDDDIQFFIDMENGRLNEILVNERRDKLMAEGASESRLEFLGYIANQVAVGFFDRR